MIQLYVGIPERSQRYVVVCYVVTGDCDRVLEDQRAEVWFCTHFLPNSEFTCAQGIKLQQHHDMLMYNAQTDPVSRSRHKKTILHHSSLQKQEKGRNGIRCTTPTLTLTTSQMCHEAVSEHTDMVNTRLPVLETPFPNPLLTPQIPPLHPPLTAHPHPPSWPPSSYSETPSPAAYAPSPPSPTPPPASSSPRSSPLVQQLCQPPRSAHVGV